MDDDRTPDESPEQPQSSPPPPPPPSPAAQERRLERSRTDRVLLGVCGGLAKHFGVDATIVRIVAVASVLFGGAGVLLYLAAALLMPEEAAIAAGPDAPTAVTAPPQRNRALVIVGAVLLVIVVGPFLLPPAFLIGALVVPLGFLALMGLLVWWIASGRRPEGGAGAIAKAAALGTGVLVVCFVLFLASAWMAAWGGDLVVAWLVIGAGVAVLGGAFLRPVRWLIVPALAVALPAGFVGAANIELDGGMGDREYRPGTVEEVSDRYELGIGELVVDLRDTELPARDIPLKLKVGIGQAVLVVPDDVCVASSADLGMGAVEVLGRDSGGIDVEVRDTPEAASGNARVLLEGDIGIGALRVVHSLDEVGHWDWDERRVDRFDAAPDENAGCVGSRGAS
jgi:phage shock protein PspC (stress-responsive transcriptional regulator)